MPLHRLRRWKDKYIKSYRTAYPVLCRNGYCAGNDNIYPMALTLDPAYMRAALIRYDR